MVVVLVVVVLVKWASAGFQGALASRLHDDKVRRAFQSLVCRVHHVMSIVLAPRTLAPFHHSQFPTLHAHKPWRRFCNLPNTSVCTYDMENGYSVIIYPSFNGGLPTMVG